MRVFVWLWMLCSVSVVAQDVKKGEIAFEVLQTEDLERTVYHSTYEVYENRDTKKGRKIGLYVVYAPAQSQPAAPDPVFFFTGGPGTGAASGALGQIPYWNKFLPDRDLVFVDQRGTGKSNGLFCKNYGPQDALQTFLGDMYDEKATRACYEELRKRADLTLYTSPIAMDDINEIRAAMGYDKINLYGTSYGGRAVLAFLRRHEKHVRTALPLVPSPPWHAMPATFAKDAQRALDMLIADCADDPACSERFPQFEEHLDQVIGRLKRAPVTATVSNLWNDEEEEVLFTYGPFSTALRSLLYSPEGAANIPVVIETAAKGDYGPIILYAAMYNRAISGFLAEGMYLSVTCAEDIPYIDVASRTEEAEGTFLGDYRIARQVGACRIWARGSVGPEYRSFLKSDVPTLVISGEHDPVCPPRWSREIAASMENARHVEIPNMAHGGEKANECFDHLVKQFIEEGHAKDLDTSCVSKVERPPFETNMEVFRKHLRQAFGVEDAEEGE